MFSIKVSVVISQCRRPPSPVFFEIFTIYLNLYNFPFLGLVLWIGKKDVRVNLMGKCGNEF